MLGKRGRAGLAAKNVLAVALLAATVSPILAATEIVPLERLHVHDVILLPTVSSAYEAHFTRPKTWQVAPSSQIHVEFQHSHELLPNRSWLEIAVNDHVIKHIPLTHENEDGTKLSIPMPVGLLKDFNTLTYRVEQHYTDKCEDPLDKSLWTQILPTSKLVFNYNPVLPKVDLGTYPYPIIDPLTYSPAQVRFVTDRQATAKELQALAYLNVHLGQQAQDHELKSRALFSNSSGGTAGPAGEHIVFVGTPDHIRDAAAYQAAFGDYAIQGGQWVNRRTGQTLSADQGVILFFQAPGSKEHTVLVVSGNSEQAVLKAAQYLTLRPKDTQLMGGAFEVPPDWNPSDNRTAKVPRFIEDRTRSFRELGFPIQEVHKINAPPITYHVPIVGDFRKENGRLWLDLVYSYSPQLNPEFSSLELRMNDISIANIPLTNPQGEQLKRASIPVSNELIRTRNDLVAQFHLMPDKYGWCVDNYVDNAWGKILDDSQFRVEGGVTSRVPDVGLMNGTMYPFSKTDNLDTVHIVIPKEPTAELLDAVLGFTARLGRTTLSDTGLRLTVSQGYEGVGGDKNVAVFRYADDPMRIPDGARLAWQAGGTALFKLLGLADINNSRVSGGIGDQQAGGYMEQYTNGGNAITVFTASGGEGFRRLGWLFSSDKAFEKLESGLLAQASTLNPDLNAVTGIRYHQEQRSAGTGNWWQDWQRRLQQLPWVTVIGAMVGVFFLFLLLPLILRRILRR